MFGKKDPKLAADEDHRKCRICGVRIPDETQTSDDVTIWKNLHLYNEHYWQLGRVDRLLLKHTVGFGLEPPKPEEN